jgi:hypothetical protein
MSVFIVFLAYCASVVRDRAVAALRVVDWMAPQNRWGRYPNQPPPLWFKFPSL